MHAPLALFPDPDEGLVRRIQQARSARARYLNHDLFADPAWDMLLELYACELGHQSIDVSSLCAAIDAPTSTALRWLRRLEEDGLASREVDRSDRRRYWVTLTPRGLSSLRGYFSAISFAPGEALP